MGGFPLRRRRRGPRGARRGLRRGGHRGRRDSVRLKQRGGQREPASTGGTARSGGGTATYALPPRATPNYISRSPSGNYFSVVKRPRTSSTSMYRPLYWFGNGASPPP